MKEILFEDLKKGDWIKHSHLGSSPLVGGYIMESPRQGRGLKSTILVDVKGSEVGLVDEMGSIYSNQIAAVLRDGEWYRVDQKRLNPMICFPNAAELKIMSNGWAKYGPRIWINKRALEPPQLHIQASNKRATHKRHNMNTFQ